MGVIFLKYTENLKLKVQDRTRFSRFGSTGILFRIGAIILKMSHLALSEVKGTVAGDGLFSHSNPFCLVICLGQVLSEILSILTHKPSTETALGVTIKSP